MSLTPQSYDVLGQPKINHLESIEVEEAILFKSLSGAQWTRTILYLLIAYIFTVAYFCT